jgi:hypothetical protein
MNTQPPIQSVSGPHQSPTKSTVSRAVVSAANQAAMPTAVPTTARRVDAPRAAQQTRDVDVPPEPGLAAVSPVSLDEARSLSLTPPQRMAIQLLTSGKSLVAAATAAGVNRTTLYRWLKGDPAFVAAYNAWQKDVRDTARGRILALSDLAITTIAKAITQGDTRSALKILKATGALTHKDPGSTDPDEIQRVQRLERLKAQTALRRAENRAEMDAEMPF